MILSEVFFKEILYLLWCFLALIPLRNAKATYEFSGSKEKINHLLFMYDLKIYSHNEKELDPTVQTILIFSKDMGMEFGIEKYAMLVIEK